MPDILDDILDMLPQSTVDLMMKHHGNASRDSTGLDEIINGTLGIRIRRATAALKKRYLDRKFKLAENSNALAKLLKQLEVSESIRESNDYEQRNAALEKKLSVYDEKIREIDREFGNFNCTQLFNSIENFGCKKEELKKNLAEITNRYECFNGIPPNIEQVKKAIDEIKEQIKCNEQKIEAFF